jgi:tetratricopeptide (TPR) repeat protein
MAEPFYRRGIANKYIGDSDKALSDFDKAIILGRKDDLIYNARAGILTEKGEFARAITDCSSAIEYNPKNADAYANRGYLYSKVNEYGKGIEDCKNGVLIDTNCVFAYNNLAWLLATSHDKKFRDGQKALEYAKRACELTNWKTPFCVGTLAAAYAEVGNFEEAIRWQKKSIELDLPEKDVKEAQDHLNLYKQNKPYHAESLQIK